MLPAPLRSALVGLALAAMVALAATFVAGCGARTGLLLPRVAETQADAGRSADATADATDGPLDGTDARSREDVVDASDVPLIADAVDDAALAAVASLAGLRWELPCESVVNASVCTTPMERVVSARLAGVPGALYAATLRFRGVVETRPYDGGSNDGRHWQIGGTPRNDTINVYGLTVSSPPQQFFLNRVVADAFACFAIDYEETVTLAAGSAVTLTARSMDGREVRNVDVAGNPIVVPGVAPAPRPFDGQFIQLDVVSVQRLR